MILRRVYPLLSLRLAFPRSASFASMTQGDQILSYWQFLLLDHKPGSKAPALDDSHVRDLLSTAIRSVSGRPWRSLQGGWKLAFQWTARQIPPAGASGTLGHPCGAPFLTFGQQQEAQAAQRRLGMGTSQEPYGADNEKKNSPSLTRPA
jgi:hypothetical protein